jgi:uncharacterized membrane protein
VKEPPNARNGKTWRVALGTRIAIGFLAAFMFLIAALMFGLQFTFRAADHGGDWIVVLAGFVMTGFAVFATFGLIAVVRIHLTIGAGVLDATVVDRHNWLLVPHFRSVRLPLSDIRSVERRCELFRQLGLSTMRDALSVVTAGGERIGLFSNTLGSSDTLPLDEVADAIAAAAGITVTDDGTVRTKGSGLYGAASSSWTEKPLDSATASRAQRAVVVTAQICGALLLLTFVLRACL